MVQQYDNDFDQELLGKGQGGPPFWKFGRNPVPGQYIEGSVSGKRSRHETVFQTKQQRDGGAAVQFKYFVGKSLETSKLPFDQFKAQEPSAKPVKELLLELQTNLRDPAKEEDDGRRTFKLPRDAKDKLAAEIVRQGIQGGLPVGAFVRVTLERFEYLEGLETPKRHYTVEVWGPGEQPSPSPAQPVVQQQAPAQQYVPASVVQAQTQVPVVQQAPAQVFQPIQQQAPVQQQAPQFTDEMVQLMVSNSMPLTPAVEARAKELGLIA